MNPNQFKFLAAIATMIIVSATGSAPIWAAGPSCTVGPSGDYTTIQAAVDDPGCAVISVAAGTYNENVIISRTLVLKGAQAGVAVGTRTSGGPAESKVAGANPTGAHPVITVNAADVEIDGFTITNVVTTGAAVGIDVKHGGNDADIRNNIIDGISTADTGGNGTAQAIYIENGPDNAMILNNDLRHITSNRSAKGVLVGENGYPDAAIGALIKGNTISNVTSTTRGAYGVSVANATQAGGITGLKIIDNWIDTLTGGGWVHAIGLEGSTPGVIVEDNDIANLTDLTPTVPSDSIAVWFEDVNTSFASATVHHNNFSLSTASFGIAVHPALTVGAVNGTCNWWNSPSGPTNPANPVATGTGVSPHVIFDPWLNGPAPLGTCVTIAKNKNQAKNDGWKTLVRADGTSFKNQGDAIQYINTGK